MRGRHAVPAALLAPVLALLLAGCEERRGATGSGRVAPSAPPASEQPQESPVVPSVEPEQSRSAAPAALVRAAGGGDGDSWKDTSGREYRMGLINTPEFDECYGSQATAKRKQLVADGFRPQTYSVDTYGRLVSVISLPDGTNLNVWMARYGYADDRYLAEFRHENPSLATELDAAFAAAKQARLGLWGACSNARSAPGSTSGSTSGSTRGGGPAGSCHPAYVTCVPVKGDGSGNGEANDLDCPDIGKRVQLRSGAGDPYRLDSDGDGYGCDSYG